MIFLNELPRVVLVGIGATVVMDAWVALLRRFGVQTLGFAFVGRWVGHLFRGRFAHRAIREAAPVRGELPLGWFTHYAIGVGFAALLAVVAGPGWLAAPSLAPAVAVGVATVAAPLLVMQPAMGAGFASSRTKTPLANCLRSLANHTVFGVGLYLAGVTVAWMAA